MFDRYPPGAGTLCGTEEQMPCHGIRGCEKTGWPSMASLDELQAAVGTVLLANRPESLQGTGGYAFCDLTGERGPALLNLRRNILTAQEPGADIRGPPSSTP